MQYLDCSVLHKRLAPPGGYPPSIGRAPAGGASRVRSRNSMNLRSCCGARCAWNQKKVSLRCRPGKPWSPVAVNGFVTALQARKVLNILQFAYRHFIPTRLIGTTSVQF